MKISKLTYLIALIITFLMYGFTNNDKFEDKKRINWDDSYAWKVISITGTIGIGTDGKLWKWNDENVSGRNLEQIGSDNDWKNVWGSGGSYIAMKNDGELWSWGKEADGQLGYKVTGDRHKMKQIGNDKWIEVSKGTRHVFAIKNDGTLWGWGENWHGRFVNDPKIRGIFEPLQIGTDSNWIKVSTSEYQTLLLKSDGTLWTILKEEAGMFQSKPVQIGNDNNWNLISAEYSRNFAIKKDGTLWAWGNTPGSLLGFEIQTGQLDEPIFSPAQLGTDNDWANVCSGELFTLAMKTNGTLWSWGYGPQHGHGNYEQIISPKQLGNETDWTYIDAAYSVALAIKNDGSAWLWGSKLSGRFGFSNKSDSILIPTMLR